MKATKTYEEKKNLALADVNGSATKKSAVRNKGIDVITKNSGTDILKRYVIKKSGTEKGKVLNAEKFLTILKAVVSDSNEVKKIPFAPTYGNLKTVTSRLKASILNGEYLGFSIGE